MAYLFFIADVYSGRIPIVGWRVATHMRTDMALDAVELARWLRVTSLYIDELARNRGPWRDADQLELATLGWVSWL